MLKGGPVRLQIRNLRSMRSTPTDEFEFPPLVAAFEGLNHLALAGGLAAQSAVTKRMEAGDESE